MIEFWVSDLFIDECQFEIPSTKWSWKFNRRDDYDNILKILQEGQIVCTHLAHNEYITVRTLEDEFREATDELVDICLILSFIYGKCITPLGTSRASDIGSIQLGEKFIRARAISGMPSLELTSSLNNIFSSGLHKIRNSFIDRRMRLFLPHWISGLTCYTLEDLFLSATVQMDIVKQCEIAAIGKNLQYFPGMKSASTRYGITPLDRDFKDMRNDLVHEGKLSGSNFSGRDKSQCAEVIAKTLNWIDSYVLQVLSISGHFSRNERWKSSDIESGLPSFSL